MVGRNPRYEIEIMIIQALEEESVKVHRPSRKNRFPMPGFRTEKAF